MSRGHFVHRRDIINDLSFFDTTFFYYSHHGISSREKTTSNFAFVGFLMCHMMCVNFLSMLYRTV
jgi:hypothetical protein